MSHKKVFDKKNLKNWVHKLKFKKLDKLIKFNQEAKNTAELHWAAKTRRIQRIKHFGKSKMLQALVTLLAVVGIFVPTSTEGKNKKIFFLLIQKFCRAQILVKEWLNSYYATVRMYDFVHDSITLQILKDREGEHSTMVSILGSGPSCPGLVRAESGP